MIGFRVDANEVIATGHLMRCIAIARQCVKKGCSVLFLLAEDKETEKLREAGFSYQILQTDWQNMDEEREILPEIIMKKDIEWLVVDSYQASKDYLAYMENFTRVMYVDDYGMEKYSVSAVLYYGVCVQEKHCRENYEHSATELLCGMKYIPLREEFSKEDKREDDRCFQGKRGTGFDRIGDCLSGFHGRESSVLITTGGTDPYNITGKFLRECRKFPAFDSVTFHVVVGSMNVWEQELEEMARKDTRIQLHKNVKKMSEYMKKCRVAVSAGGTTLYELCACGTPTVCISFADNQIQGAQALGEKGMVLYAGDVRHKSNMEEVLGQEVSLLLHNQKRWRQYSEKMMEAVDGMGAGRIAGILCGGAFNEAENRGKE